MKTKTVKQSLTLGELRFIVDKFIEAHEEGWRPNIYHPLSLEATVQRARDARKLER